MDATAGSHEHGAAVDVKGSASSEGLSRRRVIKTAVVAAAVGAGSSVLTGGVASAAPRAAENSTAKKPTTFPSGVAPAVVFLTDANTIAVNAALGNDFRVTIQASRTMGNPSGSADGQKIVFQITQGKGGSHKVSWDTDYAFSPGLPQPTLSTGAGQTDLLGFIYNKAMGKWLLAAFVHGFA